MLLLVQVLVLPVYKRHWMYHAWVESEPLLLGQGGAAAEEAWWRQGSTVQDKAAALSTRVTHSVRA
jgi:hypothetical protein